MGKEGSFLGAMLCNSVVFTWGFVEMLVWFWVSGVVSIALWRIWFGVLADKGSRYL